MGRFVSSDTVYDEDAGLQGYNLFVYCGNDPINRIDISGTDSDKSDAVDLVDDEFDSYGNAAVGYSGGGGNGSGSMIGDIGHISNQGGETPIYRYGGINPGNLVPKGKDANSGLSFSTVPKKGAAATTIEAVNSTGILSAVKDGATHVSVTPTNGTMSDWITAGSSSIWTVVLKLIVYKYME